MKLTSLLFDIHAVLASTLPANRLQVRIRSSPLERHKGIYFLKDSTERNSFTVAAKQYVKQGEKCLAFTTLYWIGWHKTKDGELYGTEGDPWQTFDPHSTEQDDAEAGRLADT